MALYVYIIRDSCELQRSRFIRYMHLVDSTGKRSDGAAASEVHGR